jgi:hypothetical protein
MLAGWANKHAGAKYHSHKCAVKNRAIPHDIRSRHKVFTAMKMPATQWRILAFLFATVLMAEESAAALSVDLPLVPVIQILLRFRALVATAHAIT